MSNRKFGKFYLDGDTVTQDTYDTSQILIDLQFVPTRVEFIAHRNQFEYIGLSPAFEDVTVGMDVPEYIIECSRDKDQRVLRVHVNRI